MHTNVDVGAHGLAASSSEGVVQESDVGGLLTGELGGVGAHSAVEAGLGAACKRIVLSPAKNGQY